jgi:DHA1 family bicyclomycin/chloramphenicol resistance-like MFS transporter
VKKNQALTPPPFNRVKWALTLGPITAVGGLGIDMYLPSFPAMAKSLGTGLATIQDSLVVYLSVLAVGQLVYGPLSDAVGRRPPIIFGLLLYIAGSAGCALSHSAEQLILFRVVQGAGASAGMVVARAMVRDLTSGVESLRMLAMMMAVGGVSPILAPLAGGAISAFFGWRAIFWVLGGIGIMSSLLAIVVLTETAPERSFSKVRTTPRLYLELLRDRRFVALVVITGLVQGANFSFMSSSAFLFMQWHRVTPGMYSVIFALNAVALIGGAQFSAMAVKRFGNVRVVLAAVSVTVVAASIMASQALGFTSGLAPSLITFFMTFGAAGFIGGPISVMALEPHASKAGAASALMGAMQMGGGSAAAACVAAAFNGTLAPLACSLAVCTVSALALAGLTFRDDFAAVGQER